MKSTYFNPPTFTFAISPSHHKIIIPSLHALKYTHKMKLLSCHNNFINSSYSNTSQVVHPNKNLYYSTTIPQIKHTPKTPLFLRAPTHRTTSSNLATFVAWAEALVFSLEGTTIRDTNGVPADHTLLLRELRWFLEDAIEDPSLLAIRVRDLPPPTTTTKDSTFVGESDVVVPMRQSLDEMYRLWRDRVEQRRPIQYIVGCERWGGFRLSVEEGVLIPRVETTEVVGRVREVVREDEGLKEGVWADLGTGSGALAIGLATVLGGKGRVVATDISPIAISVASYNVQRYGLQDKIEIRQGSWFEPVKEYEGQLAGLVSNPPYMPSDDIGAMRPEAAHHEPKLAMDGGAEGLNYLTYLSHKLSTMLKPGGFFMFETNGEKQCKVLAELLENANGSNICNVNIVLDYAGVQRFVTGFRKLA